MNSWYSYCLQKRASHAEEELIRGRTKLRFAFVKEEQFIIHSIFHCTYFSCPNSIGRHTGKQIESVIRSAYKIERQAAGMQILLTLKFVDIKQLKVEANEHFASVAYTLFFIVSGLKDILGELPRREASMFRSQVSSQITGLHLIISSFSRSKRYKHLNS